MHSSEQKEQQKRTIQLVASGALALITLWLYWPVAHFDFLNFDDPLYVSKNAHVKDGLTWEGIKWAFSTFHSSNWHPLTWLSHMLDAQLSNNPGLPHVTNVFLHIANTLLLLSLLKRITGAFWKSAAVAALFAWHPLHVESVAWISERKDVLSTCFGFLSIHAYVEYAARHSRDDVRGKKFYHLSLLAFICSLLSKPMLVTMPFLLLLIDLWPLQRLTMGMEKMNLRCLLWEKIPYVLLSLGSSTVTFLAQHRGGSVANLNTISLLSRLQNSSVSYANYLGKTFCPVDLIAFYPFRASIPIWQVALSISLLSLITFWAIRWFRRGPFFLFGWLWYLVSLVPVIGLVQVGNQAMADRYSYVPLIGIFVVVVWTISEISTGRKSSLWPTGILAFVTLGCCLALSSVQIRYWQNSVTLFQHALDVNEANPLAHHNLAEELSQQDNLPLAVTHYKRALTLQPIYPSAYLNLGNILNMQGDPQGALVHYRKAVEQQADYPKAHFLLGTTLEMQGQMTEAEAAYRQALHYAPEYADAHASLGKLLTAQNKLDEAMRHLSKAVQLGPKNADLEYALAHALALQNDFVAAQIHYRQALTLNPSHVESLNDLAWILSTHSALLPGHKEEAIQFARRACELTGYKNVRYANTFATALATNEQWGEAIQQAQAAEELSLKSHDEKTAGFLREQIKRWQLLQKSADK